MRGFDFGIAPRDLLALRDWVQNIANQIVDAIQRPEMEHYFLQELHEEPDKLLDGMVCYADGTDWNPAAGGRGMYRYDANSTSWVKLG